MVQKRKKGGRKRRRKKKEKRRIAGVTVTNENSTANIVKKSDITRTNPEGGKEAPKNQESYPRQPGENAHKRGTSQLRSATKKDWGVVFRGGKKFPSGRRLT